MRALWLVPLAILLMPKGAGALVTREQAAAMSRKAANLAVQQSKQQPKSKKSKSKQKGPKGHGSGGMGGLVAAYVNPFNVGARMRWPDEDAAPSVAFRSRTIFNLPRVPNTDGSVGGKYFGIRFVGNPSVAYNANPTMTGVAPNKSWPVTGWGLDSGVAEIASLETSFSRWRLVNWGVRIKGVGQVLTNQGTLYLLTVADSPASSFP